MNVEATTAVHIKISKHGSTNGDSLELLSECFKPTTLYDHHKIVPIPSNSIEKMYQEVGTKESTTHHQEIETKIDFSYCTLLGEIMYVYMIYYFCC